jgi:AcrR family transcriptional regulator
MEAIITAAIQVLEREGLERLTMRRIAEVAGVSVGSIYKYFPDREEILGAIIDRQLRETLISFHSLVGNLAGLPLESMVRGVVVGLVEAACAHEKLHGPLYREMSPARRTLQQRRMLDEIASLLAISLRFRDDVGVADPWAAAKLIVHVGDGVSRWLFNNPDRESADVLLDEAVRMATLYLAPDAQT